MAGQSKLADCRVCGAEGGNNYRHYRAIHNFSSSCLICGGKYHRTYSLLDHLKLQHPHMLGYLLPPDEVVLERRQHDYPVNAKTIQEAIVRHGISDLGGTWIHDDEFAVSYDMTKMRPLVVVELLTPGSLEVVDIPEKDELPYLYDDALPPTQCPVDNLRKNDKNVSHLAVSAMHRFSKEGNDKTYLIRNLVRLNPNVNGGVLYSVETHLAQVAKNWWQSVLVTVPVYQDDSVTPEGQLPEPTHIAKLLFLGEHQLQVFIVENSADLNPEAANFMAFSESLEEFNRLTHLNVQSTFPLSWTVPRWKCRVCLFMSDDLDEVKLHKQYAHQDCYCPVHSAKPNPKALKCFQILPTWEQYKAHVEAAGRKVCDEEGCKSWFYNIPRLHEHKKNVHVEKARVCEEEGCGKSFKTAKQLQDHEKTHQEDRAARLTCPHSTEADPCPEFIEQVAVERHIRVKHLTSIPSSTVTVDLRRPRRRCQASTEAPLEELRRRAQRRRSQAQQQLSQAQEQLSQAQDQISQRDERIADLERQLASLKRSSSQPSTSITLAKKPRHK